MKKFELTSESIEYYNGRKLFRIRALKEFGNVKPGDLGGFVEKESNLSQEGKAWVAGDALVSGNAEVSGNARILENAKVFGNAQVSGDAEIRGNAMIYQGAWVRGLTYVSENASIYGNAEVYCYAEVTGNAKIYDCAKVYDDAQVSGYAQVCGNAEVYDDAQVSGDAMVCGNAEVCSDSKISNDFDYACVKGFGRYGRNTTFSRTKDGGILVVCGCFRGTLEEFRERVKETHGKSKQAKEYLMIADLMEMHFEKNPGTPVRLAATGTGFPVYAATTAVTLRTALRKTAADTGKQRRTKTNDCKMFDRPAENIPTGGECGDHHR